MPRVLFCLSGSIACAKACSVLSQLVKDGVEVQAVATASALQFVGNATLEGLSRRPVYTDLWAPGRALDHIALARWADVAVVCPATANTLNRLAAGLGDDPIGCLFLAWELQRKPWLVVPAMNTEMWRHPATASSIRTLTAWGVRVVGPASGLQACGEDGPGRMVEPDAALAAVRAALG